MIDFITELIVDESKWLTASMGVAFVGVATLVFRTRNASLDLRRRVLASMTLFAGLTIGTMAFGHLLAVTTKLLMSTLEGSVVLFYLIGIVLAVPSWTLIQHTWMILQPDLDHARRTLIVNGWMAATLLAFGLQNLPLAIPPLLNIGYQLTTHRAAGWAIVGVAVVVNVGLFVGSLIFLASGQSFEEFSGAG